MWERLQTTIYGIRLNGARLNPDGQGIVDIMTDDLIEIDDQVRNNALPVENRAIKQYVDAGDATIAGDIADMETRIDGIDERIDDLETATGDAITSAEFTANASSVVSVHKHLDQAVDSESIPVASTSQAGIINASDYTAFVQLKQDVDELKNVTVTYQVTLPSGTPTQAEITSAFTSAYPTVPLVAGIKVADYTHNLAYQYDGALWVAQQFAGSIPVATSTVLGGVKSSSVNGEITVNIGGTMSLNGYDSITDRLDDIDGTGGSIEQIESEISALQTSVEGHTTQIGDLETALEVAEGDIDELDQDIVRIDGQIDAMNTAISGQQTAIGNLQTGKQNTLTAGQNITISGDVISASGGTKTFQPNKSLSDYCTHSGSSTSTKLIILQDFDLYFFYDYGIWCIHAKAGTYYSNQGPNIAVGGSNRYRIICDYTKSYAINLSTSTTGGTVISKSTDSEASWTNGYKIYA